MVGRVGRWDWVTVSLCCGCAVSVGMLSSSSDPESDSSDAVPLVMALAPSTFERLLVRLSKLSLALMTWSI